MLSSLICPSKAKEYTAVHITSHETHLLQVIHYRLADAGRLRVVELSGLYREMSLKNTELEIFLPEMDFCTELVLHFSP